MGRALAMKGGKRATLKQFTPTIWEDFGREIGMAAPFVRRPASALADQAIARLLLRRCASVKRITVGVTGPLAIALRRLTELISACSADI